MNQQWSHDEQPTSFRRTNDSILNLTNGLNLSFVQFALEMRSGNYSKCAVLFRAIVEMETQRDHFLHHARGRLDMHDACLHRPRTKTFRIYSISNCNRHILVPWHLPVSAFSFIEEDATNHPRVSA